MYKNVAARVKALHGHPRFKTWKRIGDVLRVPRGSAWSLAHGLRRPDPLVVERLELAEWSVHHLRDATANLARMIGREPPA